MEKQAVDGTTEALVRFISQFGAADLPANVRRECVRALVNAIGCTVGGAAHELVDHAHRSLFEFSGPPMASLLGRGKQADILSAAFLNGLAGAAYSFDDAYSDALLHPTGPVAMAILGLAERNPVSGADFITALALGMEVSCRLTNVVSSPPAKAEIGWSQTGIASGTGAAVAAGKLLGLDQRQLSSAIGIAVSEASGTRATHGSMSASLIFGHAAHTGLRAALLAKQGFTSSAEPVESRFGFAATFAADADASILVDGLGEVFELMSNTYKPYPCAVLIHPSLDGFLRLKRDHGFTHELIERIILRVSPSTAVLCSRPSPNNEMEAKLSLHHWVAAAAVTGKAGISEGAQRVVTDPDVLRVGSCIDLEGDESQANAAADVTVILRNGARLRCLVEHCIGSLGRPMSDMELEQKFLDQAEITLGAKRAREVVEHCWNIEKLQDVGLIASKAC